MTTCVLPARACSLRGELWQYFPVSGARDQSVRTAHDSADWRRRVVELLVVFAAYYIAGKLGQATTHIRSGAIGPVWPAHGVALAAVIIWGPRIWPALLASAFLVAFQNPVPPIAVAVQTCGATLAALAGGAMLRSAGFDRTFPRLRDALNLMTLGAAASAMISATLGVAVLYATGVQAYSGCGPAWLIYWLGDGTGVLLVTPLVLTAANFLKPRPLARFGEFGALIFALVLACTVIFGYVALFHVRLPMLAFAVLPFLIWAAIRFCVAGVSLATLLVAAVATVATALGAGPFAQNSTFINATLLDVYFIILSVTGLILATLMAERAHAVAAHERLVAEQAAMESRLRLAAIVESSEDAIVRQDLDGMITDWNAGAERLYGHAARDAIGQSFFRLVQQDGATESPDVITRQHTVHVCKDGSQVAVSLILSPIRDAAGHLVGESIIARDITERRRAVALREELAHLGRVSMLSVLTGALAHEINQPLAAVSVNAEAAALLLTREPVPAGELRDTIADIRSDNRRAGDVLQRIRTLLKKEATQYEPVGINETVVDVVKLIQPDAVRRGIRIALNLAPQAAPVRADRVQLQQVVLNLLMNACDAVQDNAPQFRHVGLFTIPGTDGMIVSVKDCGAGLSDEELARIFDPFYTTKREGMGLGLTICRAIVAAHGGSFDASRNPDKGMTFSVAFPYSQNTTSAPNAQRQDRG
jgi:PAS domain S-box-containing protein